MFIREEFIKNFYYFFWILIIGCVVGWIIEGIFTLIKSSILINHSALVIGPFNVSYKLTPCVISLLLVSYQDDSYLKIFVIGFLVGTVLEYIMSCGMELVLGFSAWNYFAKFLNINGTVCLLYSIFWGI